VLHKEISMQIVLLSYRNGYTVQNKASTEMVTTKYLWAFMQGKREIKKLTCNRKERYSWEKRKVQSAMQGN
jgi:hypothetical protein